MCSSAWYLNTRWAMQNDFKLNYVVCWQRITYQRRNNDNLPLLNCLFLFHLCGCELCATLVTKLILKDMIPKSYEKCICLLAWLLSRCMSLKVTIVHTLPWRVPQGENVTAVELIGGASIAHIPNSTKGQSAPAGLLGTVILGNNNFFYLLWIITPRTVRPCWTARYS